MGAQNGSGFQINQPSTPKSRREWKLFAFFERLSSFKDVNEANCGSDLYLSFVLKLQALGLPRKIQLKQIVSIYGRNFTKYSESRVLDTIDSRHNFLLSQLVLSIILFGRRSACLLFKSHVESSAYSYQLGKCYIYITQHTYIGLLRFYSL